MSKSILILLMLAAVACGKKSNEVQGEQLNILSLETLENTYPEVIGMKIEHMDNSPLSRSESKIGQVRFSNKPFSLSQWMIENVFFRYHHDENGYENFHKLNRLQNGVILPMQQSFFDYLKSNNHYPHFVMEVELKNQIANARFHLGFVNMVNLSVHPRKIELYKNGNQYLRTQVLNIDEVSALINREYQPVIFWEKTTQSRLNVYVVEDSKVRTIGLEGNESRDIRTILSTSQKIINFNEYSEVEEILSWNLNEDFWICFPCDANKVGSYGSAFLVKTTISALIRSNRKHNIMSRRFGRNTRFIIDDLRPLDHIHLTLKFIKRFPIATIPGGVSGSFIGNSGGDCINTNTVLSSRDEVIRRPSNLFQSTYINWNGENLTLKSFFQKENIQYTQNDQGEVEFSMELASAHQVQLVNQSQLDPVEVKFNASEMICGDRVVNSRPERIEYHEPEVWLELRIIVDGLSR
jgi:hypothetical protein